MQVQINHELEQIIALRVANGMYPSPADVIRDALYLLVERDERQSRRIATLNQRIQTGLEQAANGNFCDMDDLDAELERIIAEAEAKHA